MPSDNLPFMFAAYAIVWIAFCIYAFFISRRQQELEQEIMLLQRRLDDANTDASSKSA